MMQLVRYIIYIFWFDIYLFLGAKSRKNKKRGNELAYVY